MPYAEVNNICTGVKNNVSKIQDTLYGDNGAAFTVADTIINIYDETKRENQPGINMPISDDSVIPDYHPEYYLPLLNNTMDAWQSGTNPSAVGLDFHYNHSTTDNHTSTTSGGGGISFIWEDVSGDGSGEGLTTTTNSSQKAQVFSLTFGGIMALPIEYGIWFDDYRLAGATENPPKGDNVSALAKPVFNNFFGTADKPGQLSRYNSQIVIGNKPTWSLTLADSEQYQQLKSALAGAQVCFLFICTAGGHGTSSSNHTTTDDKSNSISFQDTTNTMYILGFIMKSYWGPN
ncbi:hypothetical protein C8R43DRAFT_1133293 [Mycena crocata]|nr:hypothetical protein C8R43DRAFT_1133293 [Mycena crocata]